MSQDFGPLIRQARKSKGYSQRDLAKLVGLDFTYVSKLENNTADYAPKEEVIRKLVACLDLNAEELIFLAGRIPEQYEELLRQNYAAMPALFRRIREDPDFVHRILNEETRDRVSVEMRCRTG